LAPSGSGSREKEGGATVHHPLSPDSTPMARHDALHRGETYSGALEYLGTMQALKHAEQLVHVAHVEADAVVLDEHHELAGLPGHGSDLDLRLRPGAGELDRVGDQIDQRDAQHRSIAVERGQRADFPDDVAAAGFALDLLARLAHDLVQVDQCRLRLGAADPG